MDRKIGNWIKGSLLYAAILLTELLVVHFERGVFQAGFLLASLIGDFFLVRWLIKKRLSDVICKILAFFGVCFALLVGAFLVCRSTLGSYRGADLKTNFFSDKNVMFVVPHQDDDINLGGGIIEQYAAAGSRVSIVYTTNGDSLDLAEIRFQESLKVAQKMGIGSENVFFLGYGDGWRNGHIYHSEDENGIWTSHVGYQQTYGTEGKDCYRECSYTRRNYLNSLVEVIMEIQPEIIYAVDYDAHSDHRAMSLMLEEAMAEILASQKDYQPDLYKGFAYRTAWWAYPDFTDQLNLKSSVEYKTPTETEVFIPFYSWSQRVRIPVDGKGLNRFLSQTETARQLALYKSQDAIMNADRVVNGDKVFWQRRTDSVLYDAQFQIGDNAEDRLQDFKLLDTYDVTSQQLGGSVVDITQGVTVQMSRPRELRFLGLYEDFDLENQILEGYVELGTGTRIPFGPLNNDGTMTPIALPGTAENTFHIVITDYTGTAPGLTEVEAYTTDITAPEKNVEYLMLVDEEDNFVYDYFMDHASDTRSFTLYTYPESGVYHEEDIQITMDGDPGTKCTFADGMLTVTCPEKQQCRLTVALGDISTTVRISNPSGAKEQLLSWIQKVDYELFCGTERWSIRGQIQYYREFYNKMQIIAESIFA